jgi:hypothetical protein
MGDVIGDRRRDRAHGDRFNERGGVLAGLVEDDAARPVRQVDADLFGQRRRGFQLAIADG